MAKALRPKSILVETLTLLAIGLLSFACATTQVSEPAEPMADAKEMKDEAMADAKEMKDDAKAKAETIEAEAKAGAMAMAADDGSTQPELVNPPEIRATGNLLDIDLRIKSVQGQTGTNFEGNNYRWYGFDPAATGTACPSTHTVDGGFCFGAPAPTLRVRRESIGDPSGGYPGDRVTIDLTNALDAYQDPSTAHDCHYNGVDVSPNCFHGDNITNFHFHGFHVSPNPNDDGTTYSDYVLVELWPEGTNLGTCAFPDCKVGAATYKLNNGDPLIQYQPEGSHWYHPHKHAATALQVMNGMAGAFIVEGPYDDWLTATICPGAPDSCEDSTGASCDGGSDCRVTEKLLILQQIIPDLGFPVATTGQPATPLVNGQTDPKITIQPGEIQRWRYFNAGVTSAANYAIEFPKESFYGKCHANATQDEWCVKMIAMDGVPFAKENYLAQPLLYKEDPNGQCLPESSANGNADGNLCFLLAAGNRADVLVQAPIEAETGTHRIGIDLQGEVLGFMPKRMRDAVRERLEGEHIRLTKLLPALEPEKVEFTIFRTHIGDSKIEGARLPIGGPAYPYNAAGTADSPWAAPADLVKTIDSPTVDPNPWEFKMTGYTGGLLPGTWNPDGDEYFGKSINQAMSCCRQWNECADADAKNCCVGDPPPGCYDVSPPPGGENVPCGEFIGQFWINDEQFGDATNYTATLDSKWQYDWQNALGPPGIETVPLPSCPPMDGVTEFTVQLRTQKNPDVIEQFQVIAQVDGNGTNGCSTTDGNHCVSGQLNRSGEGWVNQSAAELTSQTNAVQHPIHIHVNPFQVERPDHPGVAVFQDTIGLPVEEGGSFTVKQEYRSYDGTFVFHCHILGHEDRGMMQKFCVDSATENCGLE